MEHTAIEALIGAYALGATDPGESEAVEAHLPTCPACRARLAEYRELGDALLYSAPSMTAPQGMTERLQRRLVASRREAAPASRWTRLRGALLLPALAAAILLLLVTNVYWINRTNHLERQAAEQASIFAGAAIPLYADTSASYASSTYAQGVVYMSSDGRVALLCVYGMPALPSDKTYQLWLIKDGKRDSGGLFTVSGYGFGLLVVRPTRPLSEYSAVGITVEPSSGSPAPTSPRVLGGSL